MEFNRQIIERHRTQNGFDGMFAMITKGDRFGFLCSFVNPLTRWCRLVDYRADSPEVARMEKEGYVLADFRIFQRDDVENRLDDERLLRRFQREIRKDLEWADACLAQTPDLQTLRLPRPTIEHAETFNIANALRMAHSGISGD